MRQAIVKSLQGNSSLVCINFQDDSVVPRIIDLKKEFFYKTGIHHEGLRITTEGGLGLDDEDPVFCRNDCGVLEDVRVLGLLSRLRGGKGGFGSMLRAQGGRMSSQKTTNFEACRDLSGHRFKTLNLAKKLAAKKAREADLKKESSEKLEKRIQRYLQTPTTGRKRVDDSKFLSEHDKALKSLEKSIEKISKKGTRSDSRSGSAKPSILVATSSGLKPDLSSWNDDTNDILL